MAHGPYLVTPDINVWLAVGRELGRGFTLDDVQQHIREARPYPGIDGRQSDIFPFLRSLLEPYPDGEPVRVWSSEWILKGIMLKATQPDNPLLVPEKRGLGWELREAAPLVSVAESIIEQTQGGVYHGGGQTGVPPLDNDDGQVLQAARMVEYESAICERFCVTRDKHFVRDMRDYPYVRVVTPMQWCNTRAKAIRIEAMRRMLESSSN